MKGKREAVWAVIVSVILITAGLILSCGDDDDGTYSCQNACKKLVEECGVVDGWKTVEECVEYCETPNDEWEEAEIKCLIDVSCGDLMQVCFYCGSACEIIVNVCGLTGLPGGVDDLDTCYEECKKEDDGVMFEYVECILDNIGNCGGVSDCFFAG